MLELKQLQLKFSSTSWSYRSKCLLLCFEPHVLDIDKKLVKVALIRKIVDIWIAIVAEKLIVLKYIKVADISHTVIAQNLKLGLLVFVFFFIE